MALPAMLTFGKLPSIFVHLFQFYKAILSLSINI